MAPIASRVAELNGEGALSVFARAKELEKLGRSIIHLELGEPDFHPAAPVVDALRSAVAAGRDRYVSPRGISALREAVAEYLLRTRNVHAAPEQVLIAPGCKMALSLAMMALIEPGDQVLYPDPGFPIYPSFARGLGAKAVPFFLEEKNQFQPDLREIAAKISPRTKVLIFNSPNNPTGTVFSDATLAQIAELAAKHDLWVIADEIYARILFSGAYKSIWSLPGMAERTVIIDGFSKSFAMTGWRLGYAVAPQHVIDAMDLLVLNTFTCAAEFTQVAAIEALRDTTDAVDAMVAEYRKRRDLFVPQRLQHLACGKHALVHLIAVLARHQRTVLGKEQIVGIGAVHPPDLIDVAKAFGDQQRRLCAGPFQDGVDGDGRAMQEQARIGKIRARFRYACFDALNEDVWRGQRLAQQQAPAHLVEGRNVGEGAADIGRHPQSLGLCHGFAAALIQSARAFSACWASFTTSGGVA